MPVYMLSAGFLFQIASFCALGTVVEMAVGSFYISFCDGALIGHFYLSE